MGRLLVPLLKIGFPLIVNLLKPLAKSILTPLGLTAAAATDAAIYKKMFGSGTCPLNLAKQTTLIILNEEVHNIMKIVTSLEKALVKQLKMKQKNKKEDFLQCY